MSGLNATDYSIFDVLIPRFGQPDYPEFVERLTSVALRTRYSFEELLGVLGALAESVKEKEYDSMVDAVNDLDERLKLIEKERVKKKLAV